MLRLLRSDDDVAARLSDRSAPHATPVGLPRLCGPVILEPGEHSRPAVFRGVGAIARAVVGVEAVRGVGVDREFTGLAGRLARGLALLDQFLRDALIGAAIEGEDRAFHVGGDVERVLWRQLARFAVGSVPRNRGL